jgi:hypothetical protein
VPLRLLAFDRCIRDLSGEEMADAATCPASIATHVFTVVHICDRRRKTQRYELPRIKVSIFTAILGQFFLKCAAAWHLNIRCLIGIILC